MALEDGTFAYGAAVFPLTPSTNNPLLRDADPALSRALGFFVWGIENYVGARLLTQAALHGLNLPSSVGLTLGTEPSPFLYADQFKFPIFALYRKRDTWTERTIAFDASLSIWEFAYVLPPLTPMQQSALNPILRGVSAVVRRLSSQGRDPAYLDGAPVWSDSIERIRASECVYGGYEKIDANGQYYRAVTGTLSVVERELVVDGAFDPLGGTDVSIEHVSPEGTEEDLVQFSTESDP